MHRGNTLIHMRGRRFIVLRISGPDLLVTYTVRIRPRYAIVSQLEPLKNRRYTWKQFLSYLYDLEAAESALKQRERERGRDNSPPFSSQR